MNPAKSVPLSGKAFLPLLITLLVAALPAGAQLIGCEGVVGCPGPECCRLCLASRYPTVSPLPPTCPDRDGDSLCDAWEIAGGIDLNGDGKIKDGDDLLLPGANPDRPDIYLQYDYMDLPGPGGHSHNPDPAAIQLVVNAFAAKGIALHIHPGHRRLEHHRVITYFPVVTTCAGTDAVNFYELKARNFDPKRALAYHYAIFGHYNTCDGAAFCGPTQPNCCSNCSDLPIIVTAGNGGFAEKPGNDLIVSLGTFSDFGFTPTILNEAGIFMHELGHNLGLDHAGPLGRPPHFTTNDVPVRKPNYLSVMNEFFTYQGICTGATPGSTVPVSCRVDYSPAALATLDENHLNENLGIAAGNNDITAYLCPDFTARYGAGTGPIDWNCNGNPGESEVLADINLDGSPPDLGQTTLLTGARDWGNLNFAFQCASGFGPGPPPPLNLSQNELSIPDAFRKHLLFPPRAVQIQVRPGCVALGKPIAPGQPGQVTVALLGADDLDVTQVDLASLKFAGAPPLALGISDVNGDGQPDLTAVFELRQLRLHPNASSARLTGWLKNSQVFSGEDQVMMVPNMAWHASSCQN